MPDAVTLPQYFEREGGYATRGAGEIFQHGASGASDPNNPDFQDFFTHGAEGPARHLISRWFHDARHAKPT